VSSCQAFVPASTYAKPHRCAKRSVVKLHGGVRLCRHHEHVLGARGRLSLELKPGVQQILLQRSGGKAHELYEVHP
jgi:hypothetical protein